MTNAADGPFRFIKERSGKRLRLPPFSESYCNGCTVSPDFTPKVNPSSVASMTTR